MDTQKGNVSDWIHVSYEKIAENFHQWKLTEADYRTFKKTQWVVTEKIHGANFCIVTNGSAVQLAKRKEFLQPDEDFFGHQSLSNKLIPQAREIFRLIQAGTPHTLRVSIYGELFGGEYPHPDVPKELNVQAVQTGVYYSPKIEFCAFDIAIEGNSHPPKRDYLDYDKALKLFRQVGMMTAEPLFTGKYEEALEYNIEFESTIPAVLGLPKLPLNNKAEGVVIKPVKSISVETTKGRIRPIIKKKIPEFAEDSRFHQATKWASYKTTYKITSLEDETREAMLALVTETRLNNVISKIGRVSARNSKMKQRLMQLLIEDALEIFNEEYKEKFGNLSAEQQQALMEQLNQETKNLVDKYFKQ